MHGSADEGSDNGSALTPNSDFSSEVIGFLDGVTCLYLHCRRVVSVALKVLLLRELGWRVRLWPGSIVSKYNI